MIYFVALQVALHPRRRRADRNSARLAVRHHRPRTTTSRCTTRPPASSCSATCVIHRIVHSPFGRILSAIRDNQPRAISLGYHVDNYKIVAFTLSAALSALAGATKAMSFHLVTLTDVHWSTSGNVLADGAARRLRDLVRTGRRRGSGDGARRLSRGVRLAGPGGDRHDLCVCILLFRQGIAGEVKRWFKL